MRGGAAGLRELISYEDRAASYSSRGGTQVDTFIVHHAASGSLEGTLGMMRRGERGGLSATFVVQDDRIVYVTPIEYRPHTTASEAWDARAITVETINSQVGDASGWPISEASYRSLGRIAAWMAATYPGFRLDRNRVLGHREIYERYGASYATACPGGISVDRVVQEARRIIEGGFLMGLSEAEQRELLDRMRRVDTATDNGLKVLGRLDIHRWREEQQPAVRDAVRAELVQAGVGDSERLAEAIAKRLTGQKG